MSQQKSRLIHSIYTAVAHLLQGSKCCAFGDTFLYTYVIKNLELNHCCHSVRLKWSDYSPTKMFQQREFPVTELLFTGFFFFF